MSEMDSNSGILGLDHVGLNVPDLNQAVDFFTEIFGATVVFRMARFIDPSGAAMRRLGADESASFELAMLAIGPRRLELLRWWSPTESQIAPGSASLGGSHVAIEVLNIAKTLDQLRGVPGVKVLGEPVTFNEGPTPGLTNAFLLTPWGTLIELVNWGTFK
jgi:catechol 2,3-dioxygenase-like lactoylglutathione lyase family enzyme